MRLTWLSFIVSVALIVWAGETMPGFSWLAFPNAGKIFVILAVFYILSFFLFWRNRYSPALGAIRSQPEDVHAVRRWMSSWTVLLCMANAETLFGFALRMGGKTLQQCLPFYVLGSFLILWLWPRQVWSSPK
jgi:hypothetical protein